MLVGQVLYQDLLGPITMIKGEFNEGVFIRGLKTSNTFSCKIIICDIFKSA
jgi:hypothetical protein